jgi:hypothetical protein
MIKVNPAETISTPSFSSGPTSGSVGQTLTFTTSGATVSPSGDPVQYNFNWGDGTESGWQSGTSASHSWSAAGTYTVTLTARCANHQGVVSSSTTLQVTISSAPAETVSTPGAPSGTTSGTVNTSYTYTTTGATSTLVHTVEYRFNWGDGNYSSWSTSTSATKSWASASTYPVTVEARCQQHTSISSVSSALSVIISSTPSGTPLPWNARISANIPGGTELVYIANIATNDKIYMRVDLTAVTNETLANITWILPDGTEFSGRIEGTSIGAGIRLTSKKYYWPQYANINSDYIPSGYHVLRIKAIASSNLVIRTELY